MTRLLPAFIELSRAKLGEWSMVCKACGWRVNGPFWAVSEEAHNHAAVEFEWMDEKRAGA